MAHTEQTSAAFSELRQGLIALNLGIQDRPSNSVAAVVVTPDAAHVSIGSAQPLVAQAKNVQLNNLSGKTFSWTSRSPSVATVSPSGVVTGVSTGTAVIEAISEGYGGLATITVSPGTPFTSLTITGPSTGYSNSPSYFSAVVGGGTTPLQYAWNVDGVVRQTGTNANFQWTSPYSYVVGVVVTHAGSGQIDAAKSVNITWCGQQIC
jgi:hypothetical protein